MSWRNILRWAPPWLLALIMLSQIYDMARLFMAGLEAGRPLADRFDALAIIALVIEAAALFFLLRRSNTATTEPAK